MTEFVFFFALANKTLDIKSVQAGALKQPIFQGDM